MFPHKFYETGAKNDFFQFYAPYSLVTSNSRKTMFFCLDFSRKGGKMHNFLPLLIIFREK